MDTVITLLTGVTMGLGLVALGLGVFVLTPAPRMAKKLDRANA
jgi:hypothetical protein